MASPAAPATASTPENGGSKLPADPKQDERGALDFLLGKKKPLVYTAEVDYETEDGMKKLHWTVKALDGRVIDRTEEAHRSEQTNKLDQIAADCALVAEATVELTDDTGRKIALSSPEFLQGLASPTLAIEKAFSSQMGLVSGVAREVRRISAWDPDRVGRAQRNLVEAASD